MRNIAGVSTNILIPYEYYFLSLVVLSLVPMGILSSTVNVDVFLLLITVVYLVWLLIYKRELLIKYFYWIFIVIWNLIDVFVLENSLIYLPNLHTYSYHTGSFFIRVAGFLVFLTFLMLFDSRHGIKSNSNSSLMKASFASKRLIMLVTLFSYGMLFVAFIDGARNGYFATEAGSRYEYSMNADSLSRIYYPLLRLTIPIVAIASQRWRRPSILICYITIFLGYLILTGNRFGALMVVISLAFISYLFPNARSSEEIRSLSKKVLLALGACLVALLVYSLIQGIYERGSISRATENLFDRILTGQGDVWWGVYARDPSGVLHLDEIGDELQAFRQSDFSQVEYKFGIYKMMRLVAPDSVLQAYASIGVRFTASTEASVYYYFGFFGLIMYQIGAAWLVSKITNELICACRDQNIFSIICLGFLFNYLLGVVGMSEFYKLLTAPALVCYVVLIFMRLVKQRNTSIKYG